MNAYRPFFLLLFGLKTIAPVIYLAVAYGAAELNQLSRYIGAYKAEQAETRLVLSTFHRDNKSSALEYFRWVQSYRAKCMRLSTCICLCRCEVAVMGFAFNVFSCRTESDSMLIVQIKIYFNIAFMHRHRHNYEHLHINTTTTTTTNAKCVSLDLLLFYSIHCFTFPHNL